MFKSALSSLLLMSVLSPSRPSLCRPGSFGYEFVITRAVFSGEVISNEYRDPERTGQEGRQVSGEFVTKFRVGTWWKGGEAEEATVYSSALRTETGFLMPAEQVRFEVGKKYIVWAGGADDHLVNSACSRTAELEDAGDVLRQLGEGRAPERRDQ